MSEKPRVPSKVAPWLRETVAALPPRVKTAAWVSLGALAIEGLTRQLRFRSSPLRHFSIEFDETVTIDAPAQKVFRFCRDFTRAPLYFAVIERVQGQAPRQSSTLEESRWTVTTAKGATLSWETVITRLVDDRLLAWKSLPGCNIEQAGRFELEPLPASRTRLRACWRFRGDTEEASQVLHELFGEDPITVLRDDLDSLKGILETQV